MASHHVHKEGDDGRQLLVKQVVVNSSFEIVVECHLPEEAAYYYLEERS